MLNDTCLTTPNDDGGAPENYDPRALIAILSAKIKRLEAAVLKVK